MLTLTVVVILILYICVAAWQVRKNYKHGTHYHVALGFAIGFMVIVAVYAKGIYRELTGTFYTEMRSYEVVNYTQKKSRPIIILKDVKTSILLYNVKSCGVAAYDIGDVIVLETKVVEYDHSIDLRLTQSACI